MITPLCHCVEDIAEASCNLLNPKVSENYRAWFARNNKKKKTVIVPGVFDELSLIYALFRHNYIKLNCVIICIFSM